MKKHLIKLGIIALWIFIFSVVVFSILLENDIEVETDSDLTYYLNVSYDGVDKNGIISSDETIIDLKSGNIFVEDKIPDGLIFTGFVTTSDGSIGAVRRDDNVTTCLGKVVDDTNEASVDEGVWNDEHTEYTYHGLHYNENTRTVTFTVKNLKAGCVLTVGIKTKTPSTVDDPLTPEVERRRDFYNFATARENGLIKTSNTVHVFMGTEQVDFYNVTYQYDGVVPENAPVLPDSNAYVEGASVGVSPSINLEGYSFSGWTSDDVTISNGSFTMPSKNVVLKGNFTQSDSNKVTYIIEGDIPDGYVVPLEKNYYSGTTVRVDSLKQGDVFNGYKFLGWTSNDITITDDNDFIMPNSDVEITGSFKKISYDVIYQFQGTEIPDNSDELLPAVKSYYPGDVVTLEQPGSVSGYKFLGWYQESPFKMPDEDVVIYGEWQTFSGYFSPTINMEILDEKECYNEDDIVSFKINITNTSNYEIKDVLIKEKLSGVYFIDNDNYDIIGDSFVKIPSIGANDSINVFAQYVTPNDIVNTYTNEVELLGAIADNDHYLDLTKEYIATVDFDVANISLNIVKINKDNDELEGAQFTLYSDSSLNNVISNGMTFTNLVPDTIYYLKETKAPTGYQLLEDTLMVNVDENGIITIDGYTVEDSDGVFLVKIVDDKINILPNTGGSGIVPFTIIGFVIVIFSSIGYIFYKRKKSGGI